MKVLRVISDVDEDRYITGDAEKLESIYNKHKELVKNINAELNYLCDNYWLAIKSTSNSVTPETKTADLYAEQDKIRAKYEEERNELMSKYKFFHFELELVDCLTAEKDSLEEIIK